MKVPRRHIVEDADFIAPVKGDVPRPEKGVLEGRFSLTRLPVLSDNDVQAAKMRRKKGKQMTNVETNDEQDETSGKRGREKRFDLDLTAQGVTVSDETLEKPQYEKDEKGNFLKNPDDEKIVKKMHKIVSKNIVVTDLNGAMGLFGADETKLFEFLSEACSSYYQRTDRQRLNALAQGPEKNIERSIASLVAAGFNEEKARTLVMNQAKADGLI